MVKVVQINQELKKCIEDILSDILSVIKPTEDDRNKRHHAIEEFANSLSLIDDLKDAVVRPYGSFVSNLYTKSGDLDLSLELPDTYGSPPSKETKKKVLRVLMQALQAQGVFRNVNFISTARVPVLNYVSNSFGLSLDVSIDNYPGWIKSRVLYWITTIDGRFGDMVLLIKEWAKGQDINDPKNGTLNSYSLCLLVLFHFQTCSPVILPPVKKIFDFNSAEGRARLNKESLDQICMDNIEKFQQQERQRNESSLAYLFASFFVQLCDIGKYSGDHIISTYMGQLKYNYERTRSCCLFVEDPFETTENTARTVVMPELKLIAKAFTCVKDTIFSDRHVDRSVLLLLLCTRRVGSKLGVRDTAAMSAHKKLEKCQFEREEKKKLEELTKDILVVIKPPVDDRSMPVNVFNEVVNSVSLVDGLEGADRIKSEVLYYISSLDKRFLDMVLLVNEWAKAQHINDPENGTLDSYSLCLLVLFHLQTCKPAILPPVKLIYDSNKEEGSGLLHNQERNPSSLSHLLATFFEKFCDIGTYSTNFVISTYTAELKRTYGITRSYGLFVEDPFQTSENTARRVDVQGLHCIARAFTRATNTISCRCSEDRNELLSLLCTAEVGSKLQEQSSSAPAGSTAVEDSDDPSLDQQWRKYVAANFNRTSRLRDHLICQLM